MMVACLYEPAVFLNYDKFKEKYNKEINLQQEFKKPKLYMLARCQSNHNQLLYSEERVKDLLETTSPITSSNSVLINNVIRNIQW